MKCCNIQLYDIAVCVLKQVPAYHYTYRVDIARAPYSTLMEDCKNVKLVRRPLKRTKETSHIVKYRIFLVKLSPFSK